MVILDGVFFQDIIVACMDMAGKGFNVVCCSCAGVCGTFELPKVVGSPVCFVCLNVVQKSVHVVKGLVA